MHSDFCVGRPVYVQTYISVFIGSLLEFPTQVFMLIIKLNNSHLMNLNKDPLKLVLLISTLVIIINCKGKKDKHINIVEKQWESGRR